MKTSSLQYSAIHKHSDVIWPFPHGWSSEVGPHHAPCTARIKSFQHASWSLKEQTLYGTCFCTFGIYLEIFELVLIKDVQNSLEIFGVWNQYIARNPVQINKWNGNKPYLGTERNYHPPSVYPAFLLGPTETHGTVLCHCLSSSALLRCSGQSVLSWPLGSSEKNTDLIAVFQNKWVSTVFSARISVLVSKFSGLSVRIREF